MFQIGGVSPAQRPPPSTMLDLFFAPPPSINVVSLFERWTIRWFRHYQKSMILIYPLLITALLANDDRKTEREANRAAIKAGKKAQKQAVKDEWKTVKKAEKLGDKLAKQENKKQEKQSLETTTPSPFELTTTSSTTPIIEDEAKEVLLLELVVEQATTTPAPKIEQIESHDETEPKLTKEQIKAQKLAEREKLKEEKKAQRNVPGCLDWKIIAILFISISKCDYQLQIQL